ncbi:MarR family winged helix-turn-helix transcriptional regulator [Homoserinimonas sp. A447]
MPNSPSSSHLATSGVTMLLGQLGNAVVRGLKEKLKPYELHPRHYAILSELSRTPGMSQQAVSNLLLIHRSAMVALLDDLESRGYLTRERNAENRREHSLFLTDSGVSVLAELRPLAASFEDEFLSRLSPEGRTELVRLLRELSEAHDFERMLAIDADASALNGT